MYKFLLLLAIPITLFAQECDTASGQTVMFTLKPGAHAAWNDGSISSVQMPEAFASRSNGLLVRQSASGLVFSAVENHFGNQASISIFSVNGKKIAQVALGFGSGTEFSKKLSAGVYFARLEAKGKSIATTRFVVRR